MPFSVKEQLTKLHHKQDSQTDKLGQIEVSVAKQQVMLESHNVQFDRIVAEMATTNKNMAEYNKELAVHISGVMELKEQNRLMRTEIAQRDLILNGQLTEMKASIESAQKPFDWIKTTLKYLALVGSAIGGILGLLKLMKAF